MTKIFIAQFEEYGKPRLAKADLVKETEASFIIENVEKILNGSYLPNRLLKNNYHCYPNPVDAITWLETRCDVYLVSLREQMNDTIYWKTLLAELTNSIGGEVAK